MSLRRLIATILPAVVLLPGSGAALGQEYPAKAIRIVTAPPGGSNDFAARLIQEIVRVLHLPEIKEKFSAIGIETVGSSPQELTAAMKAEIARTAKLVKEAGIRSP